MWEESLCPTQPPDLAGRPCPNKIDAAVEHIAAASDCCLWPAVQNVMCDGLLSAQLLVDEPRDLGPVGAAFGLPHDVPDDRPNRLGIAFPHTLRGIGIGGERGGNDAGQLVAAIHGRESLRVDDLLWTAAANDERVEDLTSGANADALGREHFDKRGKAAGLNA